MSQKIFSNTTNIDLIIMKPSSLKNIWSSYLDEPVNVIQFYSNKNEKYRIFSNFYLHDQILFEIPECCGKSELINSGRNANFKFNCGEKAIMLCKAAIMKDYSTYDMILSETEPKKIKALGRKVKPWNQEKWENLVCTVAFKVIETKALNCTIFRETLLSTGSNLIAEATRNDRNWGIGIDIGNIDVPFPKRWKGANILGWALMEVRKKIESSTA